MFWMVTSGGMGSNCVKQKLKNKKRRRDRRRLKQAIHCILVFKSFHKSMIFLLTLEMPNGPKEAG